MTFPPPFGEPDPGYPSISIGASGPGTSWGITFQVIQENNITDARLEELLNAFRSIPGMGINTVRMDQQGTAYRPTWIAPTPDPGDV